MNEERYGELLAQHRPRLIETPEEHERLIALAESLVEKGASLAAEEEALLALLTLLISAYEAATAADEDEDDEGGVTHAIPAPYETLHRLMQSNGMELADIAPVFGNPHAAREILEGRRPISRRQGKQLSKLFQVPEKLFRAD